MSKIDVRIVQLDAQQVIAAHGFGDGPEGIAWGKLLGFLREAGVDLAGVKFYGFNNPDPAPGSKHYGYEQWAVVPADVLAAVRAAADDHPDVTVKDFPGGLYAVTRCDSLPTIGQVWRQLATWREDSPYKPAGHQWLEHSLNPVLIDAAAEGATAWDALAFDLYLPVAS
jgi:DNA gyrase inhibitor GyrI